MQLDVALVPAEARTWPATVCIVVDELRASSTITTVLDEGCAELFLALSLDEARGLGRDSGPTAVIAGERRGITPRGFHSNNSPVQLRRLGVRGRSVIISTTNGTAVVRRLGGMPAVIVGCLLNARAAASAAVSVASARGVDRIGVVCAGTKGRFALDDAVTAGVIVERLVEALGASGATASLSDAALGSVRLRSAYDDLEAALAESVAGDLVTAIGDADDIPFCARLDHTRTVGIVEPGPPTRIRRFCPPIASGLPAAG